MTWKHSNTLWRIVAAVFLTCCATLVMGQTPSDTVRTDTLFAIQLTSDSVARLSQQQLDALLDTSTSLETLSRSDRKRLAKQAQALRQTTFIPNPKRALWLALVIPGGGQIYNRKYWKLPLIYGGFFGCTYALIWNQRMYSDYSQAYLDIMDSDPNTKSYLNILPPNYDVASREEYLKSIFKRRKDYYRRYRDMSIIAFGAVYAFSVIDAYVDAELSVFDISPNLSMRVRPAVISNSHALQPSTTMGIGCALTF